MSRSEVQGAWHGESTEVLEGCTFVVIGGGVVGITIARSAVLAGLRVVLLESTEVLEGCTIVS